MNDVNDVLREYLNDWCIVYLDDILIHSKTPEEHLQHVKLVFKKLREHRLYGQLSKCLFMRNKLDYVGHVISGEGISVDRSKIDAVKDWETPKDLTQLQSCLGLCNYYRRFVRNYSMIAAPLSDVTKKYLLFVWGSSQETSFFLLKKQLISAPILVSADMKKNRFEVQIDGSQTGRYRCCVTAK